jgi:hypothetical protein
VLRKISEPKRGEVAGKRRLHNEELYDLYFSANIIRVIKSRRMRQAGHVARAEERRGAYKVLLIYLLTAIGLSPGGSTHFWQENRRERDHLEE